MEHAEKGMKRAGGEYLFGYVLPPSDLPAEERERFRRMYCGLCRVLGARYGSAARWTLNYDFVWLAVLLSDSVPFDSGTSRAVSAHESAAYSSVDDGGESATDGADDGGASVTDGADDGGISVTDGADDGGASVTDSADDGGASVTDGADGRERDAVLRGRCPVHPVRPRAYFAPTPALELAADEGLILFWWQIQDAAEDGAFSLPKRGAAAALRKPYEKAAAYRPAFDSAVRCRLEALHRLERENCPSLDRAADAFASLLREAAEGAEPLVRRRVLEQILYHLGRWIYLIDAADDLKRDAKSGDYNPVALRYGLTDGAWTGDVRREFAATLDQSVRAMAAAYELWDFGPWSAVLEAMIYRGLFRTGRAVLDGTFRRMPWSGRSRALFKKQI